LILEKSPPAWYQLAAHQQPADLSPYGPRIQTGSNKPDSFVPIPSPFQLPRPKSAQELAASQIVNAAQEVIFVTSFFLLYRLVFLYLI
jgi:hypothetical protein